MDYIEITNHDYLAECANFIGFDNWLIHDWDDDLLNHYNQTRSQTRFPVRNLNFSIDDDHIELYENFYDPEPSTSIEPNVEGRLTTLFMRTTIKMLNGKIVGKICIRNKDTPPLRTTYELFVKDAEFKLLIGLSIDNKDCYDGDGFEFDHSIYTVTSTNFSFLYTPEGSKTAISIFDKISDTKKKTLLKQYILEFFTKDIYKAALGYEEDRLSIKTTVSEHVGQDYELASVLRLHNRKLHTAFGNLAKEIISLTNKMIQENSTIINFAKLFGFINLEKDNERNLKIYEGFITNLQSFKLMDNKYVIVSNKNNLTILHVPIEFEQLKVKFKEIGLNESDETKQAVGDLFSEQKYTTEHAYFVMSLEKLNMNHVIFTLLDFKIPDFKSISESQIHLTMDYLVSYAIEENMKTLLEEVLKNESLQSLAINPPVQIEYNGNEFHNDEGLESE